MKAHRFIAALTLLLPLSASALGPHEILLLVNMNSVRSRAACEGAVLLVDASQGIQAQTLANYQKALNAGLKIIPVVNKIDLVSARPNEVAIDMAETFGFKLGEILFTSGKEGAGVEKLLDAIVARIPTTKPTLNPKGLKLS